MQHSCFSRRLLGGLILFSAIGLNGTTDCLAGDSLSVSFAAAESKTGSEGEAHPEGIPSWESDLALWSLVVFLLFVFVLGKFAWGPLIVALNKREQQVREDIAAAANGKAEIERLLAEHQEKLDAVQDEVKEILAEARRDAEHVKQDIISSAQSEAEALNRRSIADIERARDAALKELFDSMSSQVAQATEFVLGRSVTGEDQDRLIQEAMAQFSQGS